MIVREENNDAAKRTDLTDKALIFKSSGPFTGCIEQNTGLIEYSDKLLEFICSFAEMRQMLL